MRENLPDRRYPLWPKEDMKTLAGERVAELKTRGYDNGPVIRQALAART